MKLSAIYNMLYILQQIKILFKDSKLLIIYGDFLCIHVFMLDTINEACKNSIFNLQYLAHFFSKWYIWPLFLVLHLDSSVNIIYIICLYKMEEILFSKIIILSMSSLLMISFIVLAIKFKWNENHLLYLSSTLLLFIFIPNSPFITLLLSIFALKITHYMYSFES